MASPFSTIHKTDCDDAQPSRVATLGLPGTPTTDLSLKAGEGTKASHLSLSPSHHNSLRQTHTVRRNLMLLRTALGQSNFNGISPELKTVSP